MLELSLIIIASVFVLGYCGYLLSRRPLELSSALLAAGLLANLLIGIFDLLAVRQPQSLFLWRNAGLACEGLLPLIWFLFSLTFYRAGKLRDISVLQRFVLCGSLAFVFCSLFFSLENLYYSPDFAEEKILFLNQSAYLFYIGIMAYLTLAMVNLERTFSGLSQHQRWRVKLEIIGAGVVLAMSVVYYSQSLLYRSLDLSLLTARTLALILAVGLMAYSRLKRGQGTNIMLSRTVAFRSLVVLMVGLYLLTLGLLGEGIRYLGVPEQKTVFTVIGLFSAVMVLLLCLSESLRRKLKATLHRNFYRSKYDYRQQWHNFIRKTSATYSADHLELAILTQFCETFGVKGGSLYLQTKDSTGFSRAALCELGLQQENFNGSSRLVERLADKAEIIVPTEHPAELLHEGDPPVVFHGVSAFVPLRQETKLEGFIALGLPINESEVWSYEDFELMEMLASQSISAILNQQLSDELATNREMAAIGKVSTFVLHDLKNQASGLAMLTDNARDYLDDPEFQADMLETLDGTVAHMRGLISRLKNLKENSGLKFESSDLLAIAQAVIRQNGKQGKLTGRSVIAKVDVDEIYKVILNLVLNAQEADTEERAFEVEIGGSDLAFIRVSDKGCGMTADFMRDRLFKPFETTKPDGTGIGLYQTRQVVEAHGGRIEVESKVGCGSTFTVWLPLVSSD
ncbi:MAG: PEP-CTERM system histidine kinase PrsK [Geopsychrobacter sp.]|nr:PEP-CTERM system histidine kinase PrsK [Geopsychrobacter sp.]